MTVLHSKVCLLVRSLVSFTNTDFHFGKIQFSDMIFDMNHLAVDSNNKMSCKE